MEILSYIPAASGKPDSFWIACSKDEADKWFIPLLDDGGLLELKNWLRQCEDRMRQPDRGKEYEQMIRDAMQVDGLAYAYFCVARDLSECYAEVAHHPFHQLWNGYSPFWRCDHVTINTLDDLKDIVMTLDGKPIAEIVSEEQEKERGAEVSQNLDSSVRVDSADNRAVDYNTEDKEEKEYPTRSERPKKQYTDSDGNVYESYDAYCNSPDLDDYTIMLKLHSGSRKPQNDRERALLKEMREMEASGKQIDFSENIW